MWRLLLIKILIIFIFCEYIQIFNVEDTHASSDFEWDCLYWHNMYFDYN